MLTVKLFSSFHEGFGDADVIRQMSEQATAAINAPSRYNRIHGSLDARWPGQFRHGLVMTKIATTSHDTRPVFAAEWADTNGIYPVIFYLVGRKLMKIRFGVVTEVGTNDLGASVATGGMFDDDGSGVPYFYACFGGDSTNTKIRRYPLTQVGVNSADVVAGLLLSLNGKAYRTVKPTGGTATCQVSVCPYGADRMTLSAWGQATTVGFAGTDINVLTAVRNAAVAVKPEGIFVYNQGLDQWVNYTPSWRQFMHLDNGKGAFFLGDVLVVPMGDGGAIVFDGNNARPFDPGGLYSTPDKDTTRSAFTAVGAMRHWLIGATRIPSKYISGGDSLLFKYTVNDIAYTTESADVRDLDLTTEATLPSNAALKIYIGWLRPFTAVRFDTGDANTTARTMTVKVGTAASTFTTVGVKDTGFRDFTELAGAPLGASGHIVLMVDPVDSIGWIPNTIDGVEAYWMELSFSGAFDSTVSWLTCQVQPWYPSIDYTNFPLDGLDKSGCFPHFLYGRQGPSGQPLWHDMASLSEPDDIGSVVFANVGGSSENHSRNLVAIGRFGVWMLQTSDDDRPGSENQPFVNQYALIEAPSFEPAPGKSVRLNAVRINGYNYDPLIHGFLYYSWDYGKRWSRFGSRALSLPHDTESSPHTEDFGSRFRWAFGFARTTSGSKLAAPTITQIEADFEIVNRPRPVGRKVQTEPRR
jgi:hypothetical protein